MNKLLKEIITEIDTLNEPDHIKRIHFWSSFIKKQGLKDICEIGVYRGDFSEKVLRKNSQIKNYYMIDPWRQITGLNKPSNVTDDKFNSFLNETISKTDFAKRKLKILRGTTLEEISKIDEESLDYVYLDGDHTLKGITIDLIKVWPKIKPEGVISGDDFVENIWQSNINYEPTLVFPYAIHFAEAMETTIYILPYNQFLISKEQDGFKLVNLSEKNYDKIQLNYQFELGNKSKPLPKNLKEKLVYYFPKLHSVYKKILK